MRKKALLFALISLMACRELNAKPIRQTPPPITAPAPPMLPALDGEWSSYVIEQSGRALNIVGISNWWNATGWLNADGTIYLWWISPDGQAAVGVYRLDAADGTLKGRWQWADRAHIVNGRIVGEGEAMHDTIWPKPKSP